MELCYKAFDGSLFKSEKECIAYEDEHNINFAIYNNEGLIDKFEEGLTYVIENEYQWIEFVRMAEERGWAIDSLLGFKKYIYPFIVYFDTVTASFSTINAETFVAVRKSIFDTWG